MLGIAFSFNYALYAQQPGKPSKQQHPSSAKKVDPIDFLTLVQPTPADIIRQFRDAGMAPTAHDLTATEKKIVADAFSRLPPLHQKVLKEHLRSISFLDNMPNTALTSTINPGDTFRTYHITFRAGILHQSVSEWITEKELSVFLQNDSAHAVKIDAGQLPAFLYVLLHEGTHVVDGSLGLLPVSDKTASASSWALTFVKGIWADRTTLTATNDSLFLTNRYRRGGKPMSADLAIPLYTQLSKTPLASIYGSSSWHEDLAELLSVYHFVKQLKQPFRIMVYEGGKQTYSYEPMLMPAVIERIKELRLFYLS